MLVGIIETIEKLIKKYGASTTLREVYEAEKFLKEEQERKIELENKNENKT